MVSGDTKDLFAIFLKVSQAIMSTLKISQVLDLICRHVTEALQVKGACIELFDKYRTRLEKRACYGLSDQYMKKGAIMQPSAIAYVLSGQPTSICDISSDSRIQYPQEAEKEGLKSLLSVPLIVEDEAIGVLRVYTAERHEFSEEEVEFLCVMAQQSAVALRNATLYEELRTLYDFARVIGSTLSLKEVLQTMVKNVSRVLNAKGCSIRLLNRGTGELQVFASHGLSQGFLSKGTVELEKSQIDREVINTRKEVFVLDATNDPRFQYPEEAAAEGITSLLSVPLIVNDEVIGVLRVYTPVPHKFIQNEVTFINAIAGGGAIAIENARLYEALKGDYDDLLDALMYDSRGKDILGNGIKQ